MSCFHPHSNMTAPPRRRAAPSRARLYRLYRMRGQALSEFLALAAVLVPLFVLVPMIAKYQDVAAQVEVASRYVAFDAMTNNDTQSTWKTPAQLAGEVSRRFFSNADAPIKTNDVAGNFLANENLFWREPDGTPLLANFDTDVSISFGPDKHPTQSDGFTPAADGTPFIGTAGPLGVKAQGVYTGNVTVKLANLPAALTALKPFDSLNLAVTRHTSVAIDGWQAKDPPQVESRINSPVLIPGTTLSLIAPVVNLSVTAVEVGQIPAPQLGQLAFWRDVVPSDRLK